MESAEAPKVKLVQGVTKNLNQAGYPATEQTVNAEDHSPLNRIRDMLGQGADVLLTDATTSADELLHGTGGSARSKAGIGQTPISIAKEREKERKKAA